MRVGNLTNLSSGLATEHIQKLLKIIVRSVARDFTAYAQPISLATLAVMNVTKIAVPKVITTLNVAHFHDFVSL